MVKYKARDAASAIAGCQRKRSGFFGSRKSVAERFQGVVTSLRSSMHVCMQRFQKAQKKGDWARAIKIDIEAHHAALAWWVGTDEDGSDD